MMLPAGSLNHAPPPPIPRAMPFSSFLMCSSVYCSKVTPLAPRSSTAFSTPFDNEGRGVVADPIAHVQKEKDRLGTSS